MIYIHGLNQLSPKTLDIESVPIVREIKRNISFPLSNEKIKERFYPFFVFKSDIDIMERAFSLIQPATNEIRNAMGRKDSEFEAINLSRAWKMLDEISTPLNNNIQFAKEIVEWQDNFLDQTGNILNKLPGLRSQDEKIDFNNRLNMLFFKLLRNKEMAFRGDDLVNEARVERINNLKTSLQSGFLFHFKIEEELNKTPFFVVRQRISSQSLAYSDRILNNILIIKDGLDTAYKMNMNMINSAVMLYSHIKTVKVLLTK